MTLFEEVLGDAEPLMEVAEEEEDRVVVQKLMDGQSVSSLSPLERRRLDDLVMALNHGAKPPTPEERKVERPAGPLEPTPLLEPEPSRELGSPSASVIDPYAWTGKG